jgi:pimeloyl-ACP methyl ester carboxylesterase
MYPTAPFLKRAYAQAPTGQVHYYDSGGEGVPLLLIHQSPTSAIDFVDTFPHFAAAGVRVIALDLPGMGMSDAPAWEPDIDDYADAALAVLDHAGVALADVAGHHTGAQVAIAAAAKQPRRLRKLALYGVPVMTAAERRAYWEQIVPRERDEGAFLPQPGGQHLWELYQRLETLFGSRVAHRMLISRMMAGPVLWYGHNAALTHDMTDALAADRHPLLLISHAGEMLDANSRAAHALRPDAAWVSLETPCATAMDGNPGPWSEAIIQFLAREAN